MPSFKYGHPTNKLEEDIQKSYGEFYIDITNNHEEVFENDLPNEMSNCFRHYGAINQFNKNYHYFKVMLGKENNPTKESHRYRSQILAAYLERRYDMDFEVHHDTTEPKDEFGKYDDLKTIIIYGNSKDEVKSIHQQYHSFPVNTSKRVRGEIK